MYFVCLWTKISSNVCVCVYLDTHIYLVISFQKKGQVSKSAIECLCPIKCVFKYVSSPFHICLLCYYELVKWLQFSLMPLRSASHLEVKLLFWFQWSDTLPNSFRFVLGAFCFQWYQHLRAFSNPIFNRLYYWRHFIVASALQEGSVRVRGG